MTELDLMKLLKRLEGQSRRDLMPPPGEHPHCHGSGDVPPPPPMMNMHHGKGRILSVLLRHEGITQKELSEHLAIRPQSLSDSLARLEEEELICRERSETDKRELRLYLTETGKSHAEEIRRRRTERAEAFFSVLTDEEKDTLGALLEKLAKANEEPDESQRKIHHERQDPRS